MNEDIDSNNEFEEEFKDLDDEIDILLGQLLVFFCFDFWFVWIWKLLNLWFLVYIEITNFPLIGDSKKSVDDLEAELEADLDDLKLDDIDTTDVNLDDLDED